MWFLRQRENRFGSVCWIFRDDLAIGCRDPLLQVPRCRVESDSDFDQFSFVLFERHGVFFGVDLF